MTDFNADELQVRAPYFDAEADVVPFYFLWPLEHTSSCWDAAELPCIDIDHKWGEITGIEIFQAAEKAFKGAQIPQTGRLRRDLDEDGRPRWRLTLRKAESVRVSQATTSDDNWLIQADWDGEDTLTQLTVTRLHEITYRD